MGWIDDHFRMDNQESNQGADFTTAARQRWRRLGEELKVDVAEFNARSGVAGVSQPMADQFLVTNAHTGVQLIITADFDARTVRYDFDQTGDKSAGTPEGGMLSMRQSQRGEVELYSADERLTSEETRKILLEPVLFPPEMAA